jgi:hypothetical protein
MKNLLPSGSIPQTKSDEIASNLDKVFLEDYDAKNFMRFFKKWNGTGDLIPVVKPVNVFVHHS